MPELSDRSSITIYPNHTCPTAWVPAPENGYGGMSCSPVTTIPVYDAGRESIHLLYRGLNLPFQDFHEILPGPLKVIIMGNERV